MPALGAAVWLGILTSISPCPLATNIVAISFVSNRVGHTRQVLLSGLLYTLGRMIAYSALGALLVASVLAVPDLAQWLQKYMNRLLGPLLIITGLLLLEVVRLKVRGGGIAEGLQRRVEASGVWGAGILGIVFALSFCPVSAALFFGSLVPLALRHGSAAAVALRHRDSASGARVRAPYRIRRAVAFDGLREGDAFRAVGAADHGRAVSGRGGVLHPDLQLRGDDRIDSEDGW